MRRFRTLRGRLTAFAVLAATVAVTLLVVAFNLVLSTSLDRDANSRLRSRAAAAATTVDTEDGHVNVRESANDGAIDAQVWVFSGSRAVLRAAGPVPVQQAAEALAGKPRQFSDVESGNVRLYTLPLTSEGRRIGTVVAGLSLDPYDRTTNIALLASLGLAAILLGSVVGVTWLAIGRALQPVAAMTRSAAAWSEHEGDRRFGSGPLPDELGELAATFDALLDRVSASLRHEQRLSAELSHELRTPLARIIAEVELLQRRERSPEARREAYDALSRSAEQMNRILEMLMAAARAEADPQPGRSRLGTAMEQLAGEWSGPLAQKGVQLVVDSESEELAVGVDAELVERIVAPLLENAGRHARSEVRLQAVREAERVRLTVRDDGAGVEPGDEERIFEPGVSGARANGHAGAGLGLALARRLARAAGGDVSATSDGRPGATFAVDLPA